jgi:uncharacterized cofD-like protein
MPTATISTTTWDEVSRMKPLRVVGIGGGTGLPVVLRGLAAETNAEVTAIVTVTDNGGSSGRLRESFGLPAVGDLRNCLSALCAQRSVFGDIFQHRFAAGDVNGHALGNLIVTALFQKTGSLQKSLDLAADMLHPGGRVLASTEMPATLCARFTDGSEVRGEVEIAAEGKPIEEVWLEPRCAAPTPGVLEAIQEADVIVFAPGSLFTSVIPNLLVAGVAEAIRRSTATKIAVCNLMTQPGETDEFLASHHVKALQQYLGPGAIDFCIVNSASAPVVPNRYRSVMSQPVVADAEEISALGVIPVQADLQYQLDDEKVRHNPAKLAGMIMAVAQGKAQPWRAAQAA